MFDSVQAALDLRPTGALFAQAAEAGLSHQATLRHVVSSAARRADLPTIPTPFAESMHRTIFMKLPPPRVSHHSLHCSQSPLSCLCSGCLGVWEGDGIKFAAAAVEPAYRTSGTAVKFLLVLILQDYLGEIDIMLEEEQIFTEDGRFNEALLARPGPENKRPRTGKPADPDAPFVPVQTLATCLHNISSSLKPISALKLCCTGSVLPTIPRQSMCEPCLLSDILSVTNADLGASQVW